MVGKQILIVHGLFIASLIVWNFVHNASGLDGSAMCLTLPVWTRCLPVYGQIKSRDRRSVQVVTPYDPGFPSFAYDLPPCGSLSIALWCSGFQRVMHRLMLNETEWVFCSDYT